MKTRILATVLCGFSLAGCGATSPTGTPDAGDVTVIDCTNDPRVAQYDPPISATSMSGALDFVLLNANPGPPGIGTNVWTMKVTTDAGVNQPNMAVGVVPFMPDMGHGTSVTASMTSNADGTYTVQPLYLFMAGVWRVTFTTMPAAGPSDSAAIFFCIEG